jgi:hypothetical protein
MRALALHTAFDMAYIDHIASFCSLLDAPIFFLDKLIHERSSNLYPDVDLVYKTPFEWSSQDLFKNFDSLIITQAFKKTEFYANFGAIRSFFLPHGNSDKGHSGDDLKLLQEPDVVFCYGMGMKNYLKEKEVLERINHLVMIGNVRASYYEKHKSHFDKIIQKEVLSKHSKNAKTLLYAPTWDCLDGTFFQSIDSLIHSMPPEWSLIVKLHPFLIHKSYAKVLMIIDKYKSFTHVSFLEDMPLIYPILNEVDAFLGDTSSVGYDFLYFNRPLYFLTNHPNKTLPLQKAGRSLFIKDLDQLFLYYDEDKKYFEKQRQRLYNDAFGRDKDFNQRKKEVIDAIKSLCLY